MSRGPSKDTWNDSWSVGRGLKTKSWKIKTRLAELGVFMHKLQALKMNFKPLRPRLKIGPYLQGKKGQNKPENPQNWNMAKIAPKSDKFTK